MQLTSATGQNHRGHRLGIIPPDLPGHAPEERQALNGAGQDRFGAFTRQRHGEAKATVAPRQQQDRDQLTPLRKVHVDVSEITLQTPARRMGQGNERLAMVSTVLGNVPTDLVIAAQVALFVPQPPIELRRRMPLFTGGLFIGGQNLIDQGLERTQPWRRPSFE